MIFSHLTILDVEAGKFSDLKSKNTSKSFMSKSDSKPKKVDYKPKKSDSKPKKVDYKPKKEKIKPNSISQGSSISSFKADNNKRDNKNAIKNLDKNAIKNLDKNAIKNLDKNAIQLDKITTLPFSPECGKQGNCIDIGGGNGINIGDIDIDTDIDIDWDDDWDDIDWDDIDWDDIDIDIDIDDDHHHDHDDDDEDDHDHDDDDDDEHDHDDDDNGDTYIYNYGYPTESYQQVSMTEYNDTANVTETTNTAQSYVTSEIKRIVDEGTFSVYLVGQGAPLVPVNNSGYVLVGSGQQASELIVSNGSNGQIIILAGSDDLHPVKVSSIQNIDLDQNEVTLGKDDALILIYLDDSKSWTQVASKIV